MTIESEVFLFVCLEFEAHVCQRFKTDLHFTWNKINLKCNMRTGWFESSLQLIFEP